MDMANNLSSVFPSRVMGQEIKEIMEQSVEETSFNDMKMVVEKTCTSNLSPNVSHFINPRQEIVYVAESSDELDKTREDGRTSNLAKIFGKHEHAEQSTLLDPSLECNDRHYVKAFLK